MITLIVKIRWKFGVAYCCAIGVTLLHAVAFFIPTSLTAGKAKLISHLFAWRVLFVLLARFATTYAAGQCVLRSAACEALLYVTRRCAVLADRHKPDFVRQSSATCYLIGSYLEDPAGSKTGWSGPTKYSPAGQCPAGSS